MINEQITSLLRAKLNPNNALTEGNKKLNIALAEEFRKENLDLAEVNKLLSKLEGGNSLNNIMLKSDFFHCLRTKATATQVREAAEAIRLWEEKGGELEVGKEQIHSLYNLIINNQIKDENIRLEIAKPFFTDRASFRAKFQFSEMQNLSVLELALLGGSGSYSIFRPLTPKVEFLCYLLNNGAGADLVDVLGKWYPLPVIELNTIWNIAKEEIRNNKASKEENGEKIARLYLACQDKGMTVKQIEGKKDDILKFINARLESVNLGNIIMETNIETDITNLETSLAETKIETNMTNVEVSTTMNSTKEKD